VKKLKNILLTTVLSSCLGATSCNQSVTVCQDKSKCETKIVPNEPIEDKLVKSPNTVPPIEKAKTKEEATVSTLKCTSTTDGSGSYLLTAEVDGKKKPILGVVNGIPVWGDVYDPKTRCQMIKTRVALGVLAGADSFAAGKKNYYPVICNALAGVCLEDENGKVLEIATFKPGVDVVTVAKNFTRRMSNEQGIGYVETPLTSSSKIISNLK
jgi:hypothetical protein